MRATHEAQNLAKDVFGDVRQKLERRRIVAASDCFLKAVQKAVVMAASRRETVPCLFYSIIGNKVLGQITSICI